MNQPIVNQPQMNQQQQMMRGEAEYQYLMGKILPVAQELFKGLTWIFAGDTVTLQDVKKFSESVTGMLIKMNLSELMQMGVAEKEELLKGKLLEALGVFIRMKATEMDQFIPLTFHGVYKNFIGSVLMKCNGVLRDVGPVESAEVRERFGQFLMSVWLGVTDQQQDISTLCTVASMVIPRILDAVPPEEMERVLLEGSFLMSLFSIRLNELASELIGVAMEIYAQVGYLSMEQSYPKMKQFFSLFWVDPSEVFTKEDGQDAGVDANQRSVQPALKFCRSQDDPVYKNGDFCIQFVDTNALLLDLLRKIENQEKKIVAVDFEGRKLNREGELCLVQIALHGNWKLVYVVDVVTLGANGLTAIATPKGLSIKSLFESQDYMKVWFDTRNDVDALYHQFGILPKNMFDLQLSEVVDRRRKGYTVSYVYGLGRVLRDSPKLTERQKDFADIVGTQGKALFEPTCGGRYEAFQERPLHPTLLVYAAHDVRYMFTLHEFFGGAMTETEVGKIVKESQTRAEATCMSAVYELPQTAAPRLEGFPTGAYNPTSTASAA